MTHYKLPALLTSWQTSLKHTIWRKNENFKINRIISQWIRSRLLRTRVGGTRKYEMFRIKQTFILSAWPLLHGALKHGSRLPLLCSPGIHSFRQPVRRRTSSPIMQPRRSPLEGKRVASWSVGSTPVPQMPLPYVHPRQNVLAMGSLHAGCILPRPTKPTTRPSTIGLWCPRVSPWCGILHLRSPPSPRSARDDPPLVPKTRILTRIFCLAGSLLASGQSLWRAGEPARPPSFLNALYVHARTHERTPIFAQWGKQFLHCK